MKQVESFGLYHYEITGEREAAAAADLEKRLESISRDYHSPQEYILQAISDARSEVAKLYRVEIKSKI